MIGAVGIVCSGVNGLAGHDGCEGAFCQYCRVVSMSGNGLLSADSTYEA